jgi:hypothetical protein
VIGAIGIPVVIVVAAITYRVVARDPTPGPEWVRAGTVDEIARQGVTEIGDRAYVVSYDGLDPFAFAASYIDGIHETLSYCASSGWFYNEPHGTQYDVVGNYRLGPAPGSTLPRVAVAVVGDDVWVDPAQRVPGPVPGATEVEQRPAGPFCQS